MPALLGMDDTLGQQLPAAIWCTEAFEVVVLCIALFVLLRSAAALVQGHW